MNTELIKKTFYKSIPDAYWWNTDIYQKTETDKILKTAAVYATHLKSPCKEESQKILDYLNHSDSQSDAVLYVYAWEKGILSEIVPVGKPTPVVQDGYGLKCADKNKFDNYGVKLVKYTERTGQDQKYIVRNAITGEVSGEFSCIEYPDWEIGHLPRYGDQTIDAYELKLTANPGMGAEVCSVTEIRYLLNAFEQVDLKVREEDEDEWEALEQDPGIKIFVLQEHEDIPTWACDGSFEEAENVINKEVLPNVRIRKCKDCGKFYVMQYGEYMSFKRDGLCVSKRCVSCRNKRTEEAAALAKGFAADALLDKANQEWRDCRDRPITREEFISKLTLLDSSNNSEFRFLHGGLLRGIGIDVSLNPNRTLKKVKLVGWDVDDD